MPKWRETMRPVLDMPAKADGHLGSKEVIDRVAAASPLSLFRALFLNSGSNEELCWSAIMYAFLHPS